MKMEFEMDTYKSEIKPTWCPGCGDFAVLRSLQTAIHALQRDRGGALELRLGGHLMLQQRHAFHFRTGRAKRERAIAIEHGMRAERAN